MRFVSCSLEGWDNLLDRRRLDGLSLLYSHFSVYDSVKLITMERGTNYTVAKNI